MAARKRANKPTDGAWVVILEEIRSQNRATLEAVSALGTDLRGEMRHMREDLGSRIAALEAAVRQHAVDIRQLREQIANLREEIGSLKDRVGRIEEQLTADYRMRLQRLEDRVQSLEQQRTA